MRFNFALASILLFSAAVAFGGENQSNLTEAFAGIRSADPAVVQASIASLRNAGPDGLQAILEQYDQHPDATLIPDIDAVAGQRDAIWSRLYWYTDLSKAEAAAKQQRKPILYLRLMGKLTDEYSCANSRFFRTVLYSNSEISKMLRERFVLVWQSERPVPLVTIDYGDGRTLKRTLTGNSIHYVLNSDGQVFDALPGLFDPAAFLRIVSEAGYFAGPEAGIEPQTLRSKYLERADDAILRQWRDDAIKIDPHLILTDLQTQKAVFDAEAAVAMRRTSSKMAVEMPLLRGIAPQFATVIDRSIDAAGASAWSQIAELHSADATLDDQSVALIRSQNPAVYSDPAALDKTVSQFQQTIAEDSVRDNYQLRRQVLTWLREFTGPITLEDLNRRVYSELFLTPANDPWLGLMPQGLYTALTCDGCSVATDGRSAAAPK